MMRFIRRMSLMPACCLPLWVGAAEPDYAAVRAEGFPEIAQLLASMTPQQRQAVLSQAGTAQHDLSRFTPAQIQALRAQLRQMTAGIDPHQVDIGRLRVFPGKTAAQMQSDIVTYQRPPTVTR